MTTELLSGIVSLTSDEIGATDWEPFGGLTHARVKYVFSSSDSVAGLLRLDPGGSDVRHLHVGGQHHVWVVRGAVEVDGKRLDQGSYLHVPADTEHAMRAEAAGATVVFVYLKHA